MFLVEEAALPAQVQSFPGECVIVKAHPMFMSVQIQGHSRAVAEISIESPTVSVLNNAIAGWKY